MTVSLLRSGIVLWLCMSLYSCQNPPEVTSTATPTPQETSAATNHGLTVSAKPNPTGKVVNVILVNDGQAPVVLVQPDVTLNTGWTGVFTVNGKEFYWKPPAEKRPPVSEDFMIIQPGDEFEFGFPIPNFIHDPGDGTEPLALKDQTGEVEGRFVYQIDNFTKRRWPTPTPSASPSDNPTLVESLETTISFKLPYNKRDAGQNDSDGPPPGIGGGPPRPDGSPPTPHIDPDGPEDDEVGPTPTVTP